MRRAYKFLLRPTMKQAQAFAACLEDHRQLYNAALEERREAWRRAGVTVRYEDQSAQLKDIRRADPDQGRWSFSSQQATLRRLDRAMRAFFRRVRSGDKPGYPRFKGRGWWDTVEWPKDGDGCRWTSTPDVGQVRIHLQGVGHVRVHQHRRVTHHDVICHEALRIRNMTRSAAGTLDAPGSNVAAKRGLNRSILDVGWGMFLQVLAAKAESAGRQAIAVNPADTSRTCPQCGHRAREYRLTQADFTCVSCRYTGHADVVGAINLLRAGLALRDAAEAA